MTFQTVLLSGMLMCSLIVVEFGESQSLLAKSRDQWESSSNCDIPGHNIKTLSKTSVKSCKTACSTDKNCQGYVFVTGWKHCFLKSAKSPKLTIKMISGELAETQKTSSKVGEIKLNVDYDHSGKDIKRLVLDEAKACAKACREEKACAAFTFIDGYRVCWLKKTGGRLRPKVFHCGVKP